jgi:hypothetical protein
MITLSLYLLCNIRNHRFSLFIFFLPDAPFSFLKEIRGKGISKLEKSIFAQTLKRYSSKIRNRRLELLSPLCKNGVLPMNQFLLFDSLLISGISAILLIKLIFVIRLQERKELNPHIQLWRLQYYHYTTLFL